MYTLTDKERVLEFLASLEIGYTIEDNWIRIEKGDVKVDGYNGFFTAFTFNEDDSFLTLVIGED